MSQTNANNSQITILNTIHKVEGFDPTPLAVEYVDLTTQEKRKRLPVMAQLAWFRLRYPEGKIASDVKAERLLCRLCAGVCELQGSGGMLSCGGNCFP